MIPTLPKEQGLVHIFVYIRNGLPRKEAKNGSLEHLEHFTNLIRLIQCGISFLPRDKHSLYFFSMV